MPSQWAELSRGVWEDRANLGQWAPYERKTSYPAPVYLGLKQAVSSLPERYSGQGVRKGAGWGGELRKNLESGQRHSDSKKNCGFKSLRNSYWKCCYLGPILLVLSFHE